MSIAALAASCALSPSVSADRCGSFIDPQHRSATDFAPLAGFVDVCSRDAVLCNVLTRGYPPSVTTLGYCVTDAAWQRHLKDQRLDFDQYLIAQRTESGSAAKFEAFKRQMHETQGTIPDHTALVAGLSSLGRVPLGIVRDTMTALSAGIVMKLTDNTDPNHRTLYLSSVNTLQQLGPETVVLYTFSKEPQFNDGARAKSLMTQWLHCIDARNHPGMASSGL